MDTPDSFPQKNPSRRPVGQRPCTNVRWSIHLLLHRLKPKITLSVRQFGCPHLSVPHLAVMVFYTSISVVLWEKKDSPTKIWAEMRRHPSMLDLSPPASKSESLTIPVLTVAGHGGRYNMMQRLGLCMNYLSWDHTADILRPHCEHSRRSPLQLWKKNNDPTIQT